VSRTATLAGYVVLAVAMGGYQWLAWRRGRATLGRLLGHLTSRRRARWPLLAGWLWLGWHVFVRASSP
jgi:hypothetical protein